MSSLSTLGIVHTLISLIAVGAAVASFATHGRVLPDRRTGRIYIAFTVLSCLTSLGIFAHGGFGKPHALAVITLVTLLVATLAQRVSLFGHAAPAVETVAFSATFLFHLIPAATETLTRLPREAPLFDNADAPGLQALIGSLFLCFLAGSWFQLRRMGCFKALRSNKAGLGTTAGTLSDK